MYIVTFTDFKKLYDLFEGECHDLDSHLFKLRADAEVDSDEDDLEVENFDAQVSASISKQHNISKQLQDKQARLEEIEDDLPLYVLRTRHSRMPVLNFVRWQWRHSSCELTCRIW